MKRTERHHLKENELISTVTRARDTLETHRRLITVGSTAALVVVLAIVAFVMWRSRVDTQARTMLAEAMAIESAPLAPAPAPGATTPPAPLPPGTFATRQARTDAAIAKFLGVANQYPAAEPGITARYHAAGLLAETGKHTDALQRYQEVVDRAKDSIYGEMARLGIAATLAASGQHDKAITSFKELSTAGDAKLPVDGILMQLARAYVAAGKPSDARQTFQRIVDEFPQSPYAGDARRELEGLKG